MQQEICTHTKINAKSRFHFPCQYKRRQCEKSSEKEQKQKSLAGRDNHFTVLFNGYKVHANFVQLGNGFEL